jgi:aminoglycoside phosphotransferase (APT) family kinase protein
MDAKIVRVPEPAELDRMVYAAFPSWKSYRTVMLKGGLFNTTYTLESDDAPDEKYVLRVGPVRRELLLPYEMYLMDAECWAYEKMAEAGIPTSTVVHKDTTKTLLDRDFMIVKFIESVQLNRSEMSEADRYEVFRKVGRLCRKMNDIRTEKFGRVGYILNGGGYDTWSAYIRSELSEWADKIREQTTDYYTEEELCEIVSLADRYRDILDEITEPCFNHCDMWSLNVLLMPPAGSETEKPGIAAIIDPDRCCMGDPDFELSSGWMMNDAFYDGYGRRMAEDEHTVIRTNIYKMIFLLLNGYFMRTQYDDPAPSMSDKERAMKYLEALR